MKDYMINFSRPFIYSTAPSPLLTVAVKTAVEHWSEVGEERAEVCLEKSREFVKELKKFLVDDMISGDGPIVFLNLKNSQVAMAWSESLQQRGFDVRAIRYPTVPEDQAGLRISIHASHAVADIKALVSAIRQMVIEC
jgi:8-amino-7-oxononanoate synthase